MTEETIVASGFSFPEGPCFDQAGTLHLVELAAGCLSKVIGGQRVVHAELGGSPNGAAFGPDQHLYVCNNGGHWPAARSTGGRHGLGGGQPCIQRVSADGSFSTILTTIDGRPLNSPNDICFDSTGGFYFTDPRWAPRRADLSIDMSRVSPGDVCYMSADGAALRNQTAILFPNGLCIAPDGQGLLVDETATGRVYRLPVVAPGCLGEPEVYAELGADAAPDGMCLDIEGRLYVASHGSHRIFVISPGGGAVEEELTLSDAELTNVCFGGPQLTTLFVTQAVQGRVASIERDVPGARLLGRGGSPEAGTS